MKYEVTCGNGEKTIVEAWQMEIDHGVLMLLNEKGEPVAAFIGFKSVVQLPD